MTDEMKRMANDPAAAVQIAVGDPAPVLIEQKRGSGIEFDRVYFNDTKRYLLKKAHMSRDDVRIFDAESGNLVMNSHHPGKNPYDALDPLGLTNNDARYNVAGGEWESICDVTAHGHGFQSFKIRPKTMTMHGRQLVKKGDEVKFNVAKVGKLSSMSIRDNFEICGGDSGDEVYTVAADLMGRTFQFYNNEKELVAVMAKTSKALLLTAAFGSGSESTIDVAKGVDCSLVLAAVFGIMQVGSSVVGDVASNYLFDPLKDAAVDNAVDAAGAGDAVAQYQEAAGGLFSAVTSVGRFFRDNVFQ